MSPENRVSLQPPGRLSRACYLLTSLLLVHPGMLACRKVNNGPKGPRSLPVATAKAQKGNLVLTLTALGTVSSMEAVTLRSRVDGHLQALHFREGQDVQKGDLLAEIDPRPFQVQLMQAEGQLAKDQASLGNARADLERIQKLVLQGILSQQQLDSQLTLVNQLEASLQADRAQVESAKLNVTYSRITAPVSGRVGLRLVEPGNMVRASESGGLVLITPLQPITVVFTVPADQIGRVQREKKVEAFDRDMKRRLAEGKVMALDNQVEPSTGTVRVKALFPNHDSALFPNQFVNARLEVDTLQDVLKVPTVAVQRSPQGIFVYVVQADSTVDMRPVEVLGIEGEVTALKKGLKEGETVVIDGLERLRPGALVSLGNGKNGASK